LRPDIRAHARIHNPAAVDIKAMNPQGMNYAPADLNPETDLPKGFLEFLLPLHKQFTPWQQKCCRPRIAAVRLIIYQLRKPPLRTGKSNCRTGALTSATR